MVRKTILSGLLALATVAAIPSGANAYSVNFGCSHGDRVIAATAYFSAPNGSQWYVDKINYSYTDAGTLYNGSNAVAWTWATPDNRDDGHYSKSVDRTVSRGPSARVYQKTWFDQFGPDPSCSHNGYL